MKIDHETEGLQEFYSEAQMVVRTVCQPQTELDAGMVTIEDICEGFQGEDIVTYACPICGGRHSSTVYRK